MTKPRIVHVYKDVYPPVEGGIEKTIYNMVRLCDEAFEPIVITASATARSGRRKIADSVEVIEVASLGRMLSTPLAPGFLGALRNCQADLFHFHLPHPTGELALLTSRLKTPAVATYHSDIVRQRLAGKLYAPLLDRFLSKMKVIMPTSQRYLDTSQTLGNHRDRCKVVPLGIALEDFEPSEVQEKLRDEYRDRWGSFVFFLGCLRTYKGLDYLVEAIKGLPKAKLVIAGDGAARENLETKVRELGLENRIFFLGQVDHDQAVALLHSASLFCLPAHQRSEAFGLCQIEAMTCGLPVVSTDLPTGVPEVNRHEETGLIVPPADVAALAEALGRLLEDEPLREKLGEAGRKRAARNYAAQTMVMRVEEIYREVLGRKS